MFLVFLIILPKILTFTLAKRYNCFYNDTVILKFDEIGFFETPNYPTLLSSDEFSNCNLTFTLMENQNEIPRFFAVFWWNSFYEQNNDPDNDFTIYTEVSTNKASYSFPSIDDVPFLSIQGFVIFDNAERDKCPMETMCETKPYQFEDENEIISIQSSYETFYNRTDPCMWQFMAPDGYGFKISILTFDISAFSEFVIRNSTDIILNQKIIPLHKGVPYYFRNQITHYNDDKWIEIFLSADPSFISEMEFQAFISVVKKNAKKTDGNCAIVDIGNNEWLWTNNNNNNSYTGFKNNVKCKYEMHVMPKTAVEVNVNYLLMEDGVDFVKLYVTENNETKILEHLAHLAHLMLEPFNNNEKVFLFEFETDGSMQALGFEISFTNLTCQCATPIIPCKANTTFTVMENENGFYCGNLKCNFTLQPCNSSLISLEIMFQSDLNNYYARKEFRVISGNDTVWKVDDYYDAVNLFYIVYLNPANENIFEVITYPSFSPQWANFYVQPFNAPEIVKYIISSINVSSIIVSVDPEKIILIELSDFLKSQNLSLKAFRNSDEPLNIYNNESLTYNLINNQCFANNSTFECNIPNGKFIIYFPLIYTPQYFAFQLSKYFGGCVFDNNIYLTTFTSNYTISALATKDEECVITILFRYRLTYYISHLFTTAKNEMVKVYVGSEQKQLYFEFNSKTASKYQYIGLYSYGYSIIIPKNSVALFYLTRFDLDVNRNAVTLQYPFHSFITTPYYGLYKFDVIDDSNNNVFAIYNTTNNPIKFTVLEHNVRSEDKFYFQFDNNSLQVSKVGDVLIFKNKIVKLYYKTGKRKLAQNGVQLFIESINDI